MISAALRIVIAYLSPGKLPMVTGFIRGNEMDRLGFLRPAMAGGQSKFLFRIAYEP